MTNGKVGFSKAMSLGWIQIDKAAEGGPRVTKKVNACLALKRLYKKLLLAKNWTVDEN